MTDAEMTELERRCVDAMRLLHSDISIVRAILAEARKPDAATVPSVTPTDEMREAVARALTKSRDSLLCKEMRDRMDADAALLALTPFIAAIEVAAEARGEANERARIAYWLRTDPDAAYKPYDAIERNEHGAGK